MFANATNPLNPDAFNYNPDLAAQLNFMDENFGGSMVNNPSSGLLQYAPGTPLQGQNVMSALGSNDPIAQLEKQMARHQKTIDKSGMPTLDRYTHTPNELKKKLKYLKNLHDQNLIQDEEYNLKRKELLDEYF